MYVLGGRSLANLAGVHPDLVMVVKEAIKITPYDFYVFEGIRTIERQKELFSKKKTKTLDSRHIPRPADKVGVVGHAVDLYPIGNPIPWEHCKGIADAMFLSAIKLGIKIRWGGDWNMNGDSKDEKFYDGPHFELLKSAYP